MATVKVPQSCFSPTNPNLQLEWNSSSLEPLKQCPRKYFYSIIQGWRSKRSKPSLVFGERYHKALEIYDHARAEGKTFEEGQRVAVRYSLSHGTRTPDGGFIPWTTDDNARSSFTLARAVCWYLEQFKEDVAKTVILANGKPAVELKFKFATGTATALGEEFSFFGTLDKLVRIGEDTLCLDRKTTDGAIGDYYFQQYLMHNQMSLYTLAGGVINIDFAKGMVIDAVQLGVGFARFARSITYRTKGQLQEWLMDAVRIISQAEVYANEGYWPTNDTSCRGAYGPCPFINVCSADPGVRELYLKSDFEQQVIAINKVAP